MANPYHLGQVLMIRYPQPLDKPQQYKAGQQLDILDVDKKERIAIMEVKKSNRYRVCGVVIVTFGHKRRNGK